MTARWPPGRRLLFSIVSCAALAPGAAGQGWFQPVLELENEARSPSLSALSEPRLRPSPTEPVAFPLEPVRRDSRFLLGSPRRQTELVLSARRLRSRHARDWGPTVVVAGLLMTEREAHASVDEKIADGVEELRRTHHAGEKTWKLISSLGDGEVAASLLGLSWLTAVLTDSPRARVTAELSAEALLDAALLTQGLKLLSGRARPRYRREGSYLGGPARALSLGRSSSFPSGHATAAMAVATVIAGRNAHRPWVPPLAYALGGAVALSRVQQENHYASDVLVGALLGHALGRATLARSGGHRLGRSGWDWSLQPTWQGDGDVGLRLTLQRRAPPRAAAN